MSPATGDSQPSATEVTVEPGVVGVWKEHALALTGGGRRGGLAVPVARLAPADPDTPSPSQFVLEWILPPDYPGVDDVRSALSVFLREIFMAEAAGSPWSYFYYYVGTVENLHARVDGFLYWEWHRSPFPPPTLRLRS